MGLSINHKNRHQASERASKDGMAMVFSFSLHSISPSFILFFTLAFFTFTCCVGLRVPILLADRKDRIGKRGWYHVSSSSEG